jgi:gluconolactonase
MVEVFASGFRFPEGPVVDDAGGLYIVELGGARVSRITSDGTWSVFADVGGSPNGAALGPNGTLYVCNNGGRHPPARSTDEAAGHGDATPCVQRVDSDGTVATVLDAVGGTGLNAPNDLCLDEAGNLYFSDPIWEGTPDDPVPRAPLGYLAAGGSSHRIATELHFPNGVAFAPGGATLVVSESATGDLWAFDVEAPGQLGEPRKYATCGTGSLPDGFAFDESGQLLVAGHGTNAVHVFAPDGEELQRIDLGADAMPSNLAFGGDDRRQVYVTAANSGEVLTFSWPTPGLPLLGA